MRPVRRRPLGTTPRRGFALPLVVFALVLLAVIVGGFAAASSRDFRVSSNALVEQRAFGIAEQGLASALLRWGKGGTSSVPSLNLAGDTTQLRVVSRDRLDTSMVTLSKLSNKTFWLTSNGVSGSRGVSKARAERRVSMVMRVSKPNINFAGALTTYGGAQISGNATVSGRDRDPIGWTECASVPDRDTAAIGYSPGATVNVGGSADVEGAVRPDARAQNAATYNDFGDGVTWATLTAGATIVLNSSPTPNPVGDMFSCNTLGSPSIHRDNWGEPDRTSIIQGCRDYFPIIYSPGDLILNANGRGQGVLLVDGDLRINGSFDFTGIIIVRGELRVLGTGDIKGTVLAQSASLTETATVYGTALIQYSGCAVDRATTAAGVLTPAGRRAWAPLN